LEMVWVIRTLSMRLLSAENRTALGATTCQNLAAFFGCHASTETVGAGALDSAWLKCTFHCGSY
jgi:hypothetical protein